MYLLIDECCAKSLIHVATSLGHTAQRTLQVRTLGRSATDADIHRFANQHDAIVVTENGVDFRSLAGAGAGHPGIILMPSVTGAKAAALFRKVLPIAGSIFENAPNIFVEIDATGTVRSFQLP